MGINIFRQDKNFWIYHSVALVFSFITEIISTLIWSAWRPFTLTGDILWLPLYTIIILIFQSIDQKFKLHLLPLKILAIIIIAYSILTAIVAAIINQAIAIPLFWDIINTGYIQPNHLNPISLIMSLTLGRVLTFQLWICAWLFVYVSISSYKREKEIMLNNVLLKDNLKEAKLNSLNNQLNPHFLFNALNNIRFMIHENSLQADKMITSLSDILRYSLESNKHEKITLCREIDVIHRYIDIVKTQLETRLHFKIQISDSHYRYLLPPMVLQLLVENAIKHGLDNIQEGGTLSITSTEENNKLLITVFNDLPKTLQKQNQNTGIGLQNIKQRLKLLYGNTAELYTTHAEDHFIAQIMLPKELEQ